MEVLLIKNITKKESPIGGFDDLLILATKHEVVFMQNNLNYIVLNVMHPLLASLRQH